jgi:hypothetical protein
MTRLRVVTWLAVALALGVGWLDRGAPSTVPGGNGLVVNQQWLTDAGKSHAPAEQIRPGDQTFLTFPEWFLVFGPAEQADYFTHNTATTFPFLVHIAQLWDSYGIVYQQVRGNFPFNGGYHLMIVVISVSSTIEFGVKEAYETVIGRLTDTNITQTDEDRFYAQYMHDYVRDIGTEGWFLFDFKTRLKMLWTETSWTGPHLLRKWERKYFLTTELVFKIVYAKLIEWATRATYDPNIEETEVVLDRLPPSLQKSIPDLKILHEYANGSAMILVPREAPFTPESLEMANEGLQIREVAGHTSAILLSAFVPTKWQEESPYFKVLFTQTVPTKPGIKRIAVVTLIPHLTDTLRDLTQQHATIEHVFDF